MKKLFVFVVVSLFAFSISAQIELNSQGNVGIGATTNMYAKLNIAPKLSSPGANNLLIGNWWNNNEGCISIGVHNNYAWAQSWHSKPLYVNPLGNDVLFCNQYSVG